MNHRSELFELWQVVLYQSSNGLLSCCRLRGVVRMSSLILYSLVITSLFFHLLLLMMNKILVDLPSCVLLYCQ